MLYINFTEKGMSPKRNLENTCTQIDMTYIYSQLVYYSIGQKLKSLEDIIQRSDKFMKSYILLDLPSTPHRVR